MQSIGAFIEYDSQGIPYIGLLLQSDGVSISYFLAHKGDARTRIREFASSLNKLVAEVEAMPVKLVEMKGDIDGILKSSERGPGGTIPNAPRRPAQRPRRTRP